MRKRTLSIIAGFFAVTVILLVSAVLLKRATPSTIPPTLTPTPSVFPEEQKEKEAQENYARDRAAFFEEKPWIRKLPLKSETYFISYDPEQDELLATIYFSPASEISIEEQLAQAKADVVEATKGLGLDPAQVKIVYFETEKK